MTTTTDTPTLDQVLDLAYKLPKAQRGELIARLVIDLTTDAPPPAQANDAWERLNQLREEFRQIGPVAPTPAELLDTDRRERQAMIEGSARVHP